MHVLADGLDDVLRMHVVQLVADGEQAVVAVEMVIAVLGFGHAVGVEQQAVARLQLERFFVVGDVRGNAEDQIARFGEPVRLAVVLQQDRQVVPRVAVAQLPVVHVQDSIESGDKHVVDALPAEEGVRPRHAEGGRVFGQGDGTDDGPADGHEDGRRDALARDVGNHEAEALVVDPEKVVEIAAHVLRGVHVGVKLNLVQPEDEEVLGEDGLLDFLGDVQVGADRLQLPVLLLCLLDEVDLLDGFLDCPLQVGEVYRLGGEVESAFVHGRSDVLHIPVGGDHDAFQRRVAHLVDFGEERQAVHFRHVDVAEDDVDVRLGEQHL